MKKSGLLFAFIFILLLVNLVSAANQTVEDKAINCIKNNATNNCEKLNLEQKIYTFLTTGLCKDSILNNSIEINENETCWGERGTCDVELTAKAIYALKRRGNDIEKGKNWLIAQNKTETEMQWFLQIINTDETSCKIRYAGKTYKINIDKEGKISSNNLGDCLTFSTGNWWMLIKPSCQDEKFTISCDKTFNTNLLYRSDTSSTIHVLEDLKTASGENGNVTEQIESFCFKGQTGFCDYEGTLWATLILNFLGEDVNEYLPYIVSQKDKEEYKKYLPESFLYYITQETEFQKEILERQFPKGYWDANSGHGKYYDTAVALQPFYDSEFEGKTKAKEMLKKEQRKDGCWNNDIRDTGFILYSIYGIETSVNEGLSPSEIQSSCKDAGGYCMPSYSCLDVQGQELIGFCDGAYDICCDTPLNKETCADKGGVICNSNQECSGTSEETDDLVYGQICCINGYCKDITEDTSITINTCIKNNGECRFTCRDNEEETSAYSCSDDSHVCCMEKKGGSLWWIWLLLILIILVIVGILFRDKLRPFYLRLKSSPIFSKFSFGKKQAKQRINRPPFQRGFPPKRIRPPVARRPIHPPLRKTPPTQKKSERDEILNKLKEIGK